jgi:hypothetical protein
MVRLPDAAAIEVREEAAHGEAIDPSQLQAPVP